MKRREFLAAGLALNIGSAATVLGLSPTDVQQQLAASRPAGRGTTGSTVVTAGDSAAPRDSAGHASLGAAPARAAGQPGSRRAGPRGGRGQAGGMASQYIVFVKRKGQIVPVWIRTGLSDMDYSEVLEGVTASDSVLILPSAGLVQSQQDMRDRFNRITGGGAVPGMRQQTAQPSGGARLQ